MEIKSKQRTDQRIVNGKEVRVGDVIATELTRTGEPRDIYLVSEITENGLLKGAYLGPDPTRCKEHSNIAGNSELHTFIVFPKASLNIHGQ